MYATLHRTQRLTREAADDLYQQVFVHLWDDDCRRLRLWRGDGDFVGYLAPIVRNLALSHGRRSGRDPAAGPDEPEGFAEIAGQEPSPEELAAVEERRRLVERVVERLGPRDRELYRLRFVEQRKHREIAEALGRETSAVGVALVRLERRLARLLAEGARSEGISERRRAAVRSGSTPASPE